MNKTKTKRNAPRRAPKPEPVISSEYRASHEPDALARKVRAAVQAEDGKTDPAKLAQLARDNGFDLARWKHLNIGMQVMNTTNRLRGKFRRGEPVVIGGSSMKPRGRR